MAEENKQQATQEDQNWRPFEGLEPYDGIRVDEDDSPIPPEFAEPAATPEEESEHESQKEEKEENKTVDFFEQVKKAQKEDEEELEDEGEVEEEKVDPAQVEADQINALFDVFVEDYGWQDVPKEHRPKTARQLTDYIQAAIEENSRPEYACEEAKMIDDYKRRGGNPADFIALASQYNYEAMGIDTEVEQKFAIAEVLRLQGYTPDAITKKVDGYARAGILREEAEDAIGRLHNYSRQMKQAEMNEFYKQQQYAGQIQQEFTQATVDVLQKTPDIFGYKLTNKMRREIFDHMFVRGQDGQTQFEKTFLINPAQQVIAAFISLYGNTGIAAAQQKLAMDKFRESLVKQNLKTRGLTRQARTSRAKNEKKGELSSFLNLAKI